MINKLLVVTAILFLNITSLASPYNKWWDDGNRFYKNKQYDSAAFYFEKIAALKPQEATVYYNLGNTYYRLNIIGLSVLNYERALKIAPEHKEAKDNLMLAQSRIPNRVPVAEDIFFVRWWKAITSPSSTTVWSVVSLLCFLSVIALSILRMLGKIQFQGYKIQGALVSAWVLTLILAFSSARQQLHVAGVVTQNGAALMNGNKQGKSIGNIPEGTKLDIIREEHTMIEISLPDGRKGWVDKNYITKI